MLHETKDRPHTNDPTLQWRRLSTAAAAPLLLNLPLQAQGGCPIEISFFFFFFCF